MKLLLGQKSRELSPVVFNFTWLILITLLFVQVATWNMHEGVSATSWIHGNIVGIIILHIYIYIPALLSIFQGNIRGVSAFALKLDLYFWVAFGFGAIPRLFTLNRILSIYVSISGFTGNFRDGFFINSLKILQFVQSNSPSEYSPCLLPSLVLFLQLCQQKSVGVKSGEYRNWGRTIILFFAQMSIHYCAKVLVFPSNILWKEFMTDNLL